MARGGSNPPFRTTHGRLAPDGSARDRVDAMARTLLAPHPSAFRSFAFALLAENPVAMDTRLGRLTRLRVVAVYVAASLGLAGLSHVLDRNLRTGTGLVQSVDWGIDGQRVGSFTRPVTAIEPDFLDEAPALPGRYFAVTWEGFWYTREALEIRVHADGNDAAAVRIDDVVVLEHAAHGGPTTSEPIPIDAGLHRFRVYAVLRGENPRLSVRWAAAGARPRAFDPESLFPARPTLEQIATNQRLLLLRWLAAAVWTVPAIIYLLAIGLPVAATLARRGRARLPGLPMRVWSAYTSVATGCAGDSIPRAGAPRGAVTAAGVLVCVLLFGFPLFIGLDSTDLQNDESIASFAVDRILETGDWLTPESIPTTAFPGDPAAHVAPLIQKPPLKYWLVALPIELGLLPHDEFGLRFWDAAFGAVAFVYVFLIGRRLVDPVCGLAAVFLLFIHTPLVLHGNSVRSNVMEATLILSYAGGMYHFLAWSESARRSMRRFHIFCVAGYFALGFMAKFVAAAFLPIVIGASALGLRGWRRLLIADARYWAAAAGAALVFIAPWFAYEHAIHGARFWDTIFGAQVYDRMRGALHAEHAQPWSFYWWALRAQLSDSGMLVWVLAGTAFWILEAARRRWQAGVLILAWHLAPIAILSTSVAKLYHYSFPFLLPVALLGGYSAALLVRTARRIYTDPAWKGRAGRLPVRYACSAVPLAVLLLAWPLGRYAVTLESLGVERRPLSALRACLADELDALRASSPDAVSRFYMHVPRGTALTHNYYYYFRGLDRWEHLDSPADADLFVRLFVPGRRAVAFVRAEDYGAFLRRIGTPELREEVKALAVELADPRLAADQSTSDAPDAAPAAVRIVPQGTTGGLLVLPGPLSACTEVVSSAGGVLARQSPPPPLRPPAKPA